MKFCAIICEYNPFHNGHLYQMQEAKRRAGADAVLCLMSGNFVQRGEAAIMDKFIRAKHAVLAGADVVIELPTPFATANAELFAKGAIHLLSAIPSVTSLCFGAENADKEVFLRAATLLNDEPQSVSLRIKELTANGISYAKARAQAWEGLLPSEILSSPNNILGVEYARAILSKNATVDIFPVLRVGSNYKDTRLGEQFSSATAIREAIENDTPFDTTLPAFVANDLPKSTEKCLDCLEKYAILHNSAKDIARICDCTEGLENAFKKAAEQCPSLVETLTSARYTSSRIRRIALQNLLEIDEAFLRECLASPLYLRILAAKKGWKSLLSALSEATIPLLTRAHDEERLQGVAKACFEKDVYAEKIHALLYPKRDKQEIFI